MGEGDLGFWCAQLQLPVVISPYSVANGKNQGSERQFVWSQGRAENKSDPQTSNLTGQHTGPAILIFLHPSYAAAPTAFSLREEQEGGDTGTGAPGSALFGFSVSLWVICFFIGCLWLPGLGSDTGSAEVKQLTPQSPTTHSGVWEAACKQLVPIQCTDAVSK